MIKCGVQQSALITTSPDTAVFPCQILSQCDCQYEVSAI